MSVDGGFESSAHVFGQAGDWAFTEREALTKMLATNPPAAKMRRTLFRFTSHRLPRHSESCATGSCFLYKLGPIDGYFQEDALLRT